MERLGEQPVDCTVAMRAHASACSLHPLFSTHVQHVSYDLDLKDADLTDEMWHWLSRLQLRRLGLEQGGLARLQHALPAAPFQQLTSLSVGALEDGGDINSEWQGRGLALYCGVFWLARGALAGLARSSARRDADTAKRSLPRVPAPAVSPYCHAAWPRPYAATANTAQILNF
jgi:hypothetical protein